MTAVVHIIPNDESLDDRKHSDSFTSKSSNPCISKRNRSTVTNRYHSYSYGVSPSQHCRGLVGHENGTRLRYLQVPRSLLTSSKYGSRSRTWFGNQGPKFYHNVQNVALYHSQRNYRRCSYSYVPHYRYHRYCNNAAALFSKSAASSIFYGSSVLQAEALALKRRILRVQDLMKNECYCNTCSCGGKRKIVDPACRKDDETSKTEPSPIIGMNERSETNHINDTHASISPDKYQCDKEDIEALIDTKKMKTNDAIKGDLRRGSFDSCCIHSERQLILNQALRVKCMSQLLQKLDSTHAQIREEFRKGAIETQLQGL